MNPKIWDLFECAVDAGIAEQLIGENPTKVPLKYGFYLTHNGSEYACHIVENGVDMEQCASQSVLCVVDHAQKEIKRIDKEEDEDNSYYNDDYDDDYYPGDEDDFQAIGDYEMNGPDREMPQF